MVCTKTEKLDCRGDYRTPARLCNKFAANSGEGKVVAVARSMIDTPAGPVVRGGRTIETPLLNDGKKTR